MSDETTALIDAIKKNIDYLDGIASFEADTIFTKLGIDQHERNKDAMVIEQLKENLDVLEENIRFLDGYGFPDVLKVNQDQHTEQCQVLEKSLGDVLIKSQKAARDTSHNMLGIVFFWLRVEGRIVNAKEVLARAALPYSELKEEDRYVRLNNILCWIRDDDSMLKLEQAEERLRVVSKLMGEDETLPSDYRNDIANKLMQKVAQTTYVKYISKLEFYSLQMIQLSEDISPYARKEAQDALEKRLRSTANPISVEKKVEYYTVFINLIDCHGSYKRKGEAIKKMLAECDHDMECQYREEKSQFLTTRHLLNMRYEYSHYTVLTGVEKEEVCKKLLNQINQYDNEELTAHLKISYGKMKVVLLLDQLTVMLIRKKQENYQKSSLLNFFSRPDSSQINHVYQKAVEAVWRSPVDRAYLDELSLRLDNLIQSPQLIQDSLCDDLLSDIQNHTNEIDFEMAI